MSEEGGGFDNFTPIETLQFCMRKFLEASIDEEGQVNFGMLRQAATIARDLAPYVHPKPKTGAGKVQSFDDLSTDEIIALCNAGGTPAQGTLPGFGA